MSTTAKPTRGLQIGMDHHSAKLNPTRVRRIRADKRTLAEIAAAEDISVIAVWKVKHGLTWAHVPWPAGQGPAPKRRNAGHGKGTA